MTEVVKLRNYWTFNLKGAQKSGCNNQVVVLTRSLYNLTGQSQGSVPL